MVDEAERTPGTSIATTEDLGGKMRARDIAIGRHGINFTNAGEVMAFARMMADSDLAVPKHLRGKPGACLAVIDDAIRFGMSPYALARESYAVNEAIAYMAKAVAGIIIKRGPFAKRPRYAYSGEAKDGTLKCTVTFFPIDEESIEHESPMIKDIKVKNSPLWTSDPPQQLGYYTVRAGARLHFPDVLMGLYDYEELAAGVPRPAREAEYIDQGDSIMRRLPGPAAKDSAQGFDAEHVERETNGNGDHGEAVANQVEDQTPAISATELFESIHRRLQDTRTRPEVDAIAKEFVDAAETSAVHQNISEEVEAAIADRYDFLSKPAPKNAGGKAARSKL